MNNILRFLGFNAEDKVTRFKGVITSVSFDLYGCVQFLINPGLNKDGVLESSNWFDVSRVDIKVTVPPVMESPDFTDYINQGPESKPVF